MSSQAMMLSQAMVGMMASGMTRSGCASTAVAQCIQAVRSVQFETRGVDVTYGKMVG